MKKTAILSFLPVFISFLPGFTIGFDSEPNKLLKRRKIFITPFYQYTNFKKLRFPSHLNEFYLIGGNSTYQHTDSGLSEYNEIFGNEYFNTPSGIRHGSEFTDYPGISIMAGSNHFDFRNRISGK